jgi:DNA-binding HxlR family transcriptional regulator
MLRRPIPAAPLLVIALSFVVAACGTSASGRITAVSAAKLGRWTVAAHIRRVLDLSNPRSDGAIVVAAAGRLAFLRSAVREAFFGVRRYGQLQRNLGIARNVLAERLRQLVSDGMLERVRYRTNPDWYEYRLTERALDLYPVIVGLMRCADRHLATEDDAAALELIHRSCGKPAEPYLACSRCHEPLTARDITPTLRPPAPSSS